MEGKQKGFLSCCVACSSFGFPNGLLRVLSYSLCFSPFLLRFLIFVYSCRFAAALRDLRVWVMNVVPIDAPDTLPVIYERGLFGIYHDWCESFSTYPRSYDLVHADHLFSKVKQRCVHINILFLIALQAILFI